MDNIETNKDKIRELLIKSIHSDKFAREYFNSRLNDNMLLNILVDIAVNPDDNYTNDSRMEASYWISQFETQLLFDVEEDLLILQKDELDSIACHSFVALGKIKSARGLDYLIHNRIMPELHWEGKALECYFDNFALKIETDK